MYKCTHLKEIRCDTNKRQGHFLNKCPKSDKRSLCSRYFEVNVEIREIFIDLVSDPELKVKILKGGYESFWLQENLKQKFPNIWKKIRLLFIAFPLSYVVEKALSLVINIFNKRFKGAKEVIFD